jgi:MbtH protein
MSKVLASGAGASLVVRPTHLGTAAPLASPTGMRIIMANPFEDPDASYRVLVNDEGQHSLWPANQPTPDGWTVAHDTATRGNCLEYIEKNWTDMRPKSLIEAEGR